jgi:nicotinamide mononucleotide adenylyltransferase
MCKLAVGHGQAKESAFIMVDTWEPLQSEYQPTAKVLDHFRYEINERLGGVDDGTGRKIPAKVALLGGADLVETFITPGVWASEALDHSLEECEYCKCLLCGKSADIKAVGAIVIERAGTDLATVLTRLKPAWKDNIRVIHQVKTSTRS